MKTWKIMMVLGVAVLAIGLLAASAYATVVRSVTTPYVTYKRAEVLMENKPVK